jgi:two-component system, LytTR family, response regulator LytT
MHILIVDDEAPARGELRFILQGLAPDAVLIEAADGADALALVEEEPIDVVFLDINLPGMDGLAVAATIAESPQPPLIVFATAYDEHALKAIELAALDYVVKPFDERRLEVTMGRVRRTLDERGALEKKQAAVRAYLSQASPSAGLTKLWGEREAGSRVLVDYRDILWIEAGEKDVHMQTAAGEKLRLRQTLKDLEPRLAPHNFARVHKAFLVNLDYLSEVAPWSAGVYTIRMKDKARTEIPMSRRYAAAIKKMTGWN